MQAPEPLRHRHVVDARLDEPRPRNRVPMPLVERLHVRLRVQAHLGYAEPASLGFQRREQQPCDAATTPRGQHRDAPYARFAVPRQPRRADDCRPVSRDDVHGTVVRVVAFEFRRYALLEDEDLVPHRERAMHIVVARRHPDFYTLLLRHAAIIGARL